jgi:hypothetical protein
MRNTSDGKRTRKRPFLLLAVLSASVSVSQRYLPDATMESINSTPPSMSSLPSNRDTSMSVVEHVDLDTLPDDRHGR